MAEFSKSVEVAFQKAKALLWPVKPLLWLKLFVLYLSIGGCGAPIVNVPYSPHHQEDQKATLTVQTVQSTQQFIEDWKPKVKTLWETVRPYIYAAVAALVLLILALVLLTIWFFARMQMVLLKCLYENTVDIGRFWKETREAGQSFFMFVLWISGFSLLFWLLIGSGGFGLYYAIKHSMTSLAVTSGVCVGLLFVLLMTAGFFLTVMLRLVPIVMIRLGDSPAAGFKRVWNWMRENPKPALGWFFLYFVLMIGVGMAVMLVAVLASVVVMTPVVVAGVLITLVVKSLWGKIILAAIGAVLLSVLILAVMVASAVPAGTFFTYLKMELIERVLSRTPQSQAHAEE